MRVVYLIAITGVLCVENSLFAQKAESPAWVSTEYFDILGSEMQEVREIEELSRRVVAGCRASFDWPDEFPQKILVQLRPGSIPQVSKGISGRVSLMLGVGSSSSIKAEWLVRTLLTRYATWKGSDRSPPLWLVNAVLVRGLLAGNPQSKTLLLRRITETPMPSLAQRVQSYDRMADPGWDYLLFNWLKSGSLDSQTFQRRLLQYWKSGYDWTQLNQFFTSLYPDLNGAELELLWRTYASEELSSETVVCLTESDSLNALEELAKFEVTQSGKIRHLRLDTWYLYRADPVIVETLQEKQLKLEVLVISIHPYFFNACHSLSEVMIATLESELGDYQAAVERWNQDMLDAQQLTFETDKLLEALCP